MYIVIEIPDETYRDIQENDIHFGYILTKKNITRIQMEEEKMAIEQYRGKKPNCGADMRNNYNDSK